MHHCQDFRLWEKINAAWQQKQLQYVKFHVEICCLRAFFRVCCKVEGSLEDKVKKQTIQKPVESDR